MNPDDLEIELNEIRSRLAALEERITAGTTAPCLACGYEAPADIRELSPAAAAGAPLPSSDPDKKFAPAAAASVVAPETKAKSVDAEPGNP